MRHRTLWLALGLALVLRLQGFLRPLMPDESGFLLVGRHWHPTPDNMYGDLWVDRPPVLIGTVHLADVVGGQYAPRVLASAFVLLFVLAAYRCGLLVGGRSVAGWTGLAAAAMSGQPDLTTFSAKSETFGVPLVMTSCWLALEALQRPPGRSRHLAAFGCGLVGALALGMKQNLWGAAVFGVVLVVASIATRSLGGAEALRLSAWGAGGFALPLLGMVSWAVLAGVDLGSVWYMLYGFRADAWDVILTGPLRSTLLRAQDLVVLSLLSGVTLVLLWALFRVRDTLRAHPAAASAVVAMILVDGVGLVLSGSYWGSNLTALFPGALLALALVLAGERPRAAWGMKALAVAAVVSTAVTSVVWSAQQLRRGTAGAVYAGQAIGDASEPGDGIAVLYGAANVTLASGLEPRYEHLWSLPARTVDAGLPALTRSLSGPEAPAWVVTWVSPNAWGIDSRGTVRRLLAERYRAHGRVCGRTVLLRRDLERPDLSRIDCRKPWV